MMNVGTAVTPYSAASAISARTSSARSSPWSGKRCPEPTVVQPWRNKNFKDFQDEQFAIGRRDAVYYVRAIEEPTPTLSADPLGCEFDESGQCIKAEVCRVGVHENRGECIAPAEHRAWSSPIFVNYSS
mgnify:CR=1 FL=1